MFGGFPGGSVVKNLPANAGVHVANSLQSGRSPRRGNDNPLQFSCLGNPMDRGAWGAAVHGVARVGHDFTFTFHSHALKKEMAIHSSVLAWRIPGMWEPGGLLSVGSHRVRHD